MKARADIGADRAAERKTEVQERSERRLEGRQERVGDKGADKSRVQVIARAERLLAARRALEGHLAAAAA